MEEKGSNSRVKRCTGVYSFRIEGYSGLNNRVGESTESPEFELCGHLWQLRIFPGGSLDSHKGYLSLYLASKSTKSARASYKLCVNTQIPGGTDEVFASSGVRFFEAKGVQIDGWGRDKFASASVITNPDYGFIQDDTIIFKVEITVFGDLEILPHNSINHLNNHPPSLIKCLEGLLEDQDGVNLHDVEIVFGGASTSRLRAHKCILSARSPVFRAMLRLKMSEATTGLILIPDVDYEVMKEVLHYMYTDRAIEPPLMENMCEGLFCAAAKYQILGLQMQCEEYLLTQLSIETVVPLLRLGDTYSSTKLKDHALSFMASHAETVLQSREYSELEPGLKKEADAVIEAAAKRKGCRGAGDNATGERRFSTSCVIC